MNGIVVGVDVSVRRGLDAVVLDEELHIVDARAQLTPDGLRTLLKRWRPETVAIDSPPGKGHVPGASSRVCEQRLRDLGVNIFLTPSDPIVFAKPFYQWIRFGEKAFKAAAEVGFAVQDDAAVVHGRALEVFPHASDVFLRGYLPAPGTTRRVQSKRAWRLATLRDAGVAIENLCMNRVGQPTLDSIDAALAAVTAHHVLVLVGTFSVFGEQGEWIVVPGTRSGRFSRSE